MTNELQGWIKNNNNYQRKKRWQMNWKTWEPKTKFQISNFFVLRAGGSGLKPSFKCRAWSGQIFNVGLLRVFPSTIGVWGLSKTLGLGIPLTCFKINSVDFRGLAALLNWAKWEERNLRNANSCTLLDRNWRVKDLLHLLCTPLANTMELKVTDLKLNRPAMKQLRKRPRHKYGAWLKSNDSY